MGNMIALYVGDAEYSVEKASANLEFFINMLQTALEEGATDIVFQSGNYRGAQYVKVPIEWEWVD